MSATSFRRQSRLSHRLGLGKVEGSVSDQSTTATAISIAVIEDDAVMLSQIVRALETLPNVRPYNSLDEVLKSRPSTFQQLILVLGPSQTDQKVLEEVGDLVRDELGT